MRFAGKPLFSWKRSIFSVGVLVILVVLGLVGYASVRIHRLSKILNNFEQIHKGQTKQEVLKVLGSPDEANTWEYCGPGCAERFWYYGLIERWGVDFDANGKVIDSFYNVSP
jgi:hypothetical protein